MFGSRMAEAAPKLVALGFAALALSAAIAVQRPTLWTGRAVEASAPKSPVAGAERADWSARIAAGAIELEARPLFSSNRRPTEPESDAALAAARAAAQSGPDVRRVVGLINAGGRGVMLISSERDGGVVRLRVGDRVEGWMLAAVERSRAVFVDHQRRRRIIALGDAI